MTEGRAGAGRQENTSTRFTDPKLAQMTVVAPPADRLFKGMMLERQQTAEKKWDNFL